MRRSHVAISWKELDEENGKENKHKQEKLDVQYHVEHRIRAVTKELRHP